MAAIGLAPRSPMAAENIRDLQRWTGQGRTGLALQLRICLQMGFSGGGLMRPSPERPGDNVGRLDARLREPYGYAADFLNGPADKGRIGGILTVVWVGPGPYWPDAGSWPSWRKPS